MRMFLNAIFDYKPKDKAFVTLPPILNEMLRESNCLPQRILFELYDVNEAASEARTPHAQLMKRFPQLRPYWHGSPEGHGFFSNFPVQREGEAVFPPRDPAIDLEVLEGMCAAIPRPCSFYSAIALWDGISWYPDSDPAPALRSVPEPPGQHHFYECCVGYQSNCLLLSSEYGTGPELELRVELTERHPMEQAQAIVDRFAQRLGRPVKQCVRAVFPWALREELAGRLAAMRPRFAAWRGPLLEELKALYLRAREVPPDKPVSPKMLVKRFVARNGFTRHELCRWDDRGWCKRLPQGYWLHLDLSVNPMARYGGPADMGLVCYGVNFRLRYGCSLYHDLGMPRDTPADEAAFQVFQTALDRFQQELVPQLVQTFGETPAAFYQHSYVLECSKEFDV